MGPGLAAPLAAGWALADGDALGTGVTLAKGMGDGLAAEVLVGSVEAAWGWADAVASGAPLFGNVPDFGALSAALEPPAAPAWLAELPVATA